MSPVRQRAIVVNRRCFFHLVYFVVFSVILLSEGNATARGTRRSNRSVTKCVADSAVRLVRCGYTEGCIWAEFRCDDVIDCDDGSDESEATCRGGSACDGTPGPTCPHQSTCRSVAASETRLAHHVCDCDPPFTGVNCTEITPSTTTHLITEATDEGEEITTTVPESLDLSSSSTVLTNPSTVQEDVRTSDALSIFTRQGATVMQSEQVTDQTRVKTESHNNTSPVSTTENTTHTLSSDSTTIIKNSTTSTSTREGAKTLTALATTSPAMTTGTLINQSNITTSGIQTDPTTNVMTDDIHRSTNRPSTAPPIGVIVSTSTEASSADLSPSSSTPTQQEAVGSVSPTNPQTVDGTTRQTTEQPWMTIKPTQDTIPKTDVTSIATQSVHTSSTPNPNNATDPSRQDDGGRSGSTAILVVVFTLLGLIPLAIFFHCRMRKKRFSMLDSNANKNGQETTLNETKEKSKPGHRRNTSISSIKFKDDSTLLGNELPLDVNMNKPTPIPPVICITPAPDDVTTKSPFGTPRSKKNSHGKQHNLPDTQLWFPDDGAEEPPYFVTDNVPLPVSMV